MADNKKVIISVVINDAGAKTKLKEISNETNNLGNGADKASKGFLRLGKTFTAIARGFVIVKSFQLLAKAITESIKILADFELSMAKVKAITGSTDQEFKKLEKSAKDLALGTIFTATQVAELQLAYAKLGFTTEEILNATEATTKLATITGDDLAGSADVVGAAIRGFGLEATEASRVVDVMAKSFSESALNLDNFKQSMKTVAPIANAANISLEQTTAMLGVLSNVGLRGTIAATGLKNIMSALTDPTSDLARFLGYTVNSSNGLQKAFQELGEEGIDLAIASGLIDERAKAAFITLANGVDDVERLKEVLDEATGASDEMASVIEDTLTVKWQKFGSAIENQVLNVLSDTGDLLGDILDIMTKFLNEQDRGFKVISKNKDVWEDLNETLGVQGKVIKENQIPFNQLKKLYHETKEGSLALRVELIKEREELQRLNEMANLENLSKRGITKATSDAIIKKAKLVDGLEIEVQQRDEIQTKLREEYSLRKQMLNTSEGSIEFYQDEIRLLRGLINSVDDSSQAYRDYNSILDSYLKKLKEIEGSGKDPIDIETSELSNKLLKEQLKLNEQNAELVLGNKSRYEAQVSALNKNIQLAKKLKVEFKDGDKDAEGNLTQQGLDRVKEFNLKRENLIISFRKKLLNINKDWEKKQAQNELKNKEDKQEYDDAYRQMEFEKQQAHLEAMSSLTSGFNDIYQNIMENRLNSLQTANEKELSDFDKLQKNKASLFDIDMQHQLDTFIGSESAKADFEKQKGLERLEFEKKQELEREKLRKKQLDEENKIAKTAFRANQVVAISEIGINLAKEISAIKFNASANPLNAITAGAAGVAQAATLIPIAVAGAALQTGAVLSQKFQPKTFQDGGIVSGALHRDGGVPFTVKGQGGFEMEGGEYIMSRKAVNKVGVDFLDRINFDGKAPDNSYMFANGGVVPRVQNNAINQAELADMIGEAIAMRISQIPVVNVATDTSSISRKVFNAQAMATF